MSKLELPINKIINGDSLTILKTLPSESIDCCMSSPPYWALRDYGESVKSIFDGDPNCEHDFEFKERKLHGGSTSEEWAKDMSKGMQKENWITEDGFCSKCNAWKGQLGLEPDFNLYIKHLCDIYDQVFRVLKKSGTCWVNLGDTYYTKSGGGFENDQISKKNKEEVSNTTGINKANELRGRGLLKDKCLTLIPERFVIEMVGRGWILRNRIVWFKRNSMPTSVKDRFANKWEYVFFFVKNRKYYFDMDSIRKPHVQTSVNRINTGFKQGSNFNYRVREARKGTLRAKFGEMYKATPEEIENYGSPRARTYRSKYNQLKDKAEQRDSGVPHDLANCNPLGGNPGDHWDITTKPHAFAHFACYPQELCEMPIKAGCPKDGIVLDPFFGSGTTGLVTLKLNRKFIGIELNPEYIKIAEERIKPYLEQVKL